MNLPERINVMQVISYDVNRILDDFSEHLATCQNRSAHNCTNVDEMTIEDVLDYISSWVEEDFGVNAGSLIYQDENGNQL